MSVDLACVIYADSDRDELLSVLGQLLPEKVYGEIRRGRDNEVEVVRNLDFDPVARRQFPGGFLHFRQLIEIFPEESKTVSLENQVALVSLILEYLWASGIPAVAGCDYEDKLPHGGGYKSTETPWVKPDTN